MTYAVRIRVSLEASRSRGLDFSEAWALAMEEHPVPELQATRLGRPPADALANGGSWLDVLPFLEKVMEQGFNRKPILGRAKPFRLVPLGERTEAVSERYVKAQGGRTSLERSAEQIG